MADAVLVEPLHRDVMLAGRKACRAALNVLVQHRIAVDPEIRHARRLRIEREVSRARRNQLARPTGKDVLRFAADRGIGNVDRRVRSY